LFDFGSTHIDAAAKKVINQVVAQTHTYSNGRYAISASGHADRAGRPDYNLALSLKRAEAVRNALVAAGISADVITIAGRGETEPDVATPDGVPERANRRVVIDVQ
jgi:OOP family OmpA-OmpF porin